MQIRLGIKEVRILISALTWVADYTRQWPDNGTRNARSELRDRLIRAARDAEDEK
jgi:hypothetical protein